MRRAFLCGEDRYTGESYEHRRAWIEDRVLEVASVFAIDIASFAIMSNHYHLVLHVDTDAAAQWSTDEIVERWHTLFNASYLSKRYAANADAMLPSEREHVVELAERWRSRLNSVSWFMRCINEPIARQANAEDNCTGSFWEGRFKNQALLDEAEVLAAMAYVDLNPIRANMADTPETSDHTSIQRRIRSAEQGTIPRDLMRFQGNSNKHSLLGIPFALEDYVQLVDWTGRGVRGDKRGAIDHALPPFLERLQLDEGTWFTIATEFERNFRQWLGSETAIQNATRNVAKTRSRSPPLLRAG
ncbi:MAG: transposase [Pseudomonadota bacterium]